MSGYNDIKAAKNLRKRWEMAREQDALEHMAIVDQYGTFEAYLASRSDMELNEMRAGATEAAKSLPDSEQDDVNTLLVLIDAEVERRKRAVEGGDDSILSVLVSKTDTEQLPVIRAAIQAAIEAGQVNPGSYSFEQAIAAIDAELTRRMTPPTERTPVDLQTLVKERSTPALIAQRQRYVDGIGENLHQSQIGSFTFEEAIVAIDAELVRRDQVAEVFGE